MSGVVFIICIPSAQYENICKKDQESVREDFSDVSNLIPDVQIILNPENSSHYENDNSSSINDQAKFESMEKALRTILSNLSIKNAIWQKNVNFIQVIFSLTTDDRCEEVLALLNENSIGRLFDSSVSVMPCTVYYHVEADNRTKEPQNLEETEKSSTWRRFVSSVKARLTVAQVVENVRNRAELTFDFVCLVSIATILCAIGLVENSNVYLLSSMLISPMMGPVMAGTFGSVVQDKCLLKIGVQNELIGLGIATLVGFCYGSVICFVTDKYGEQDWPTYEMTSRGELRTLWVGCLIALLSGAAVALGILSDNIASLVGVAISTSLMPPAVNAGLLWSLAGVYYIKKDTSSTNYSGLKHTGYYSTDPLKEFVYLGAVSICLTFVNIICIYVAGVLVFKIKEVAPMASKCHYKKQFWTRDIKIARDYNNKTLQRGEGRAILPIISQHLYDFHRDQGKIREQTISDHFMCYSTDLSRENPKISTRRNQQTWSSYASKPSGVGKLIRHEKYHSSQCRDSSSTLNIKTSELRHDLSRMFDSCNTDASLSNVVPGMEKTKSSETVMSINSRKFIVTPSTYDPLK